MRYFLYARKNTDVEDKQVLSRKRKEIAVRNICAKTCSQVKSKNGFKTRGRKNWVEPLREWVQDTKQALVLGSSDDLHEISNFVRKVGTNPVIASKSMHFRASPPSENTARVRAEMLRVLALAGLGSELNPSEVSFCDPTENRTLVPSLRRMCPSR